MNTSILRLTLITPALLLLGATRTTTDAALKCGPQLAGTKPVVQIDGAFYADTANAQAVLKTWDPADVISIEILCLNPQDSTVTHGSGIPLISIKTKQGPASYIKPVLATILAAQDEHFRQHAAYTSDVSSIKLPFRAKQLQVSLDVSANGWVAKATVEQFTSTCFVFDGSVAAPAAGLAARKPECVANR